MNMKIDSETITITDCDIDSSQVASVMAALGHPARIKILRQLAGCGECCCGDVVERLDLAQSTVSQHLKVLVAAGLVIYEPQGPRSRYVLNRPALQSVSSAFGKLMDVCCSPPSQTVTTTNS